MRLGALLTRRGGAKAWGMSDERQCELEIKLSYLEKHIEEQDRAMFGMATRLDALERHLRRLNDAVKSADARGAAGEGFAGDERPPHY